MHVDTCYSLVCVDCLALLGSIPEVGSLLADRWWRIDARSLPCLHPPPLWADCCSLISLSFRPSGRPLPPGIRPCVTGPLPCSYTHLTYLPHVPFPLSCLSLRRPPTTWHVAMRRCTSPASCLQHLVFPRPFPAGSRPAGGPLLSDVRPRAPGPLRPHL